MKINQIGYLLVLLIVVVSCKKDDDTVEIIPPDPLSETIVEDDAAIKAFLQTHFYNYEEFENPGEDFDFKIQIDTVAGENADKTPLWEMESLKSGVVTMTSGRVGITDEDETIDHTYYYIEVREGEGASTTAVDSVYVKYQGSLLNGSVFDESYAPIWFDLAASGIRAGFSAGVSHFKAGGSPVYNDDGTFSVNGYGIGLVVFPSALGYYSQSAGSIPAYSPLVFKIELWAAKVTDHDGDGVPTSVEDLNHNGYIFDDDTDGDNVINAYDIDDDGDGIGTYDEIEVDDAGNIIFTDTDNDGIPDYLDDDTP